MTNAIQTPEDNGLIVRMATASTLADKHLQDGYAAIPHADWKSALAHFTEAAKLTQEAANIATVLAATHEATETPEPEIES